MPSTGTPPGLPGRRGVFGCWCKWTSGLEVPRLRSHYSTVFFLPYPSTGCPDPSYVQNWLLGWEMKKGNRVHTDTDTHIYSVGICVMTCRGISDKGT